MIWRNSINFEGHLINEVRSEMQVEAPLQQINAIKFHRSEERRNEAKLDIKASWSGDNDNAFFIGSINEIMTF